jgi:hypothetical protein
METFLPAIMDLADTMTGDSTGEMRTILRCIPPDLLQAELTLKYIMTWLENFASSPKNAAGTLQ